MIPTRVAFLIATLVQAILYGLFLDTFTQCIRWLLCDDQGWKLRAHRKMNHAMLTIAILILALTSADTMVTLKISLTLLRSGNGNGNGLGGDLSLVNPALKTFTALIISAVLIFRCWSVYGKSWRIICLPLLLWTCNIVCPILFIPHRPTTSGITFASGSPWMHALQVFYSFNFAITSYATVAIIYRICTVARASHAPPAALYDVCRVFTGTGMMYTLTSLALLLSSFKAAKDPFPFLLCDAIGLPMAGITFNFLLIRAGQLRARQASFGENAQGTTGTRLTTLLPHVTRTITDGG